ncbi:hypothetical protein JWG45_20755 [Leptospira sp. 201903070]|jgi:hypothetical protein|uniref:Uncharacterized protein n=1 Tax=Leptospira ainlahdjerensis TaxID=2810033 RepID=A0ABS2UGR5_9LEPT|nr:hypothetical protein [Leptospira ainlahdjerensis]MBM9579580.1 hypothetical protein [Leptospira ainlahdjerensis]
MTTSKEYEWIREFYGEKKAERSQVPLIRHIDEGLEILSEIGASEFAKRAFCLHPIFQSDTDLRENHPRASDVEGYVMMLVMEYRKTANSYLSKRTIQSIDEIELSPLLEVNQMLYADKIQNQKDFRIYHASSHGRSQELEEYFKNWLKRLEPVIFPKA